MTFFYMLRSLWCVLTRRHERPYCPNCYAIEEERR